MRTTVILSDEVYAQLARRAVERYGSIKTLSRTLNGILTQAFEEESTPKSMFGAWRGEKGVSARGLRDEGEPH